MRAVALLAVAAAAACAVAPRRRLPESLARLTLVEDHPQITPVAFDHALHVDARAMGREVACAECHHTLRDAPGEVPAACTTCHEFAYLAPPKDESKPHAHGKVPDL